MTKDHDLIDRQAAIDALGYCQTYLFDSKDDDKKISLEDAGYAIEQLPSAQHERTACKYCHEDRDGYVSPLEKNGHLRVKPGRNRWILSVIYDTWCKNIQIYHCPMCGRRLTDG